MILLRFTMIVFQKSGVQRRERGEGLQTKVLHPLFVYDVPNDQTEKEEEHREHLGHNRWSDLNS